MFASPLSPHCSVFSHEYAVLTCLHRHYLFIVQCLVIEYDVLTCLYVHYLLIVQCLIIEYAVLTFVSPLSPHCSAFSNRICCVDILVCPLSHRCSVFNH